jgi:hypothetical protein
MDSERPVAAGQADHLIDVVVGQKDVSEVLDAQLRKIFSPSAGSKIDSDRIWAIANDKDIAEIFKKEKIWQKALRFQGCWAD